MNPTLRVVAFGPQSTPGTPAAAPMWLRVTTPAHSFDGYLARYQYDFSTRCHTLTWGGVISYLDPVLLGEMRPGGGPHPRLHSQLFRRLAQRTTRKHQRRTR